MSRPLKWQALPFRFAVSPSIDYERNTLYVVDEPGSVGVFDISTPRPSLIRTIDVPMDVVLDSYFDPYSSSLFVSGFGGTLQYDSDGTLVQQFSDPLYSIHISSVVLPSSVSIPEPRSVTLILFGALLLVRGRKRRG